MKLKVAVLVSIVMLASTTFVMSDEAKEQASTVSSVAGLKKAKWLTSFSEAKQEATKRKVPILADFSGSDWCGWCIKLDKEVFSKPEFAEYASKHLVLLLVDFPRKKPQDAGLKKQNQKLSDQFGIEGFPTVILLNAEGNVIARTGYQPGGAEAYVKHLQKLIENK